MFTASVMQCEKGVIAFSVEGLVMGSIIGQVNPQITNNYFSNYMYFQIFMCFFRKRINISVTIVSQSSVLLYIVILMFIDDLYILPLTFLYMR